jgi:methionyl-tRNA formyltransferase
VRIAFFGTPQFAVPTLRALLASSHQVVFAATQPDKPRGRGQRVSPGPVKALALERDVPVLQPETLTRAPWEASFAHYAPDLGVVAAYGKILPDWLLALPARGLINVHASLLPRYRGASPVQHAIMHGDAETGVTIMRVVKALDAGPMLASVRVGIDPDARTDQVESVLATIGASLLVDTVDRLAAGPLTELPQDDTAATYAPRLRKEDGRIDWQRPARALHDQIRALHPWPHAYTFGPRGRLILHRSAVEGEDAAASSPGLGIAAPGTVLVPASPDAVRVTTGAGVLRLLDLQAESGKVLPAREFQAGHPLPPGTRLGSS